MHRTDANIPGDRAAQDEPIYFVYKRLQRWRAILGNELYVDPLRVEGGYPDGHACWTLQTYLHMKKRGRPVFLVERWVPGRINVAFYSDIRVRDLPARAFIVGIQPDRPRPHLCEMRVVQNRMWVKDPDRDHFMNLFPETGIMPRDASRGDRVERIGYLGRVMYLAPPFRSDAFRDQLAARGAELVVKETAWNDYRDLDCVLAVRDITDFDLSIKPANKLFNTWHGECVPLLGAEPEYRATRTSELDYLEVRTPEEALAAIDRLRSEPGLFAAMIEAGRRRRVDFTADAVAERWERLLWGPVVEGYRRWLKLPEPLRSARQVAKLPMRIVRHHQARRQFRAGITR